MCAHGKTAFDNSRRIRICDKVKALLLAEHLLMCTLVLLPLLLALQNHGLQPVISRISCTLVLDQLLFNSGQQLLILLNCILQQHSLTNRPVRCSLKGLIDTHIDDNASQARMREDNWGNRSFCEITTAIELWFAG